MKGGLYGCKRGALVGTTECADEKVRQYIFPYNDDHLQQISRWVEEAAPEEFPKGIRGVRAAKKFHRFRHTFCTEVVKDVGATAEGLKVAQGLMRHKHLGTTDRYSKGAVGEGVSREALRMVRKAREARQQAREQQQEAQYFQAISLSGKSNSLKRKTAK
jgi:integrase